MAIDPTVAHLSMAAIDQDRSALGPLADWYEENGYPDAAESARNGWVWDALIKANLYRDFADVFRDMWRLRHAH